MTEIRKNDFIYDKNLKTQTFTYMYIKKKRRSCFYHVLKTYGWVGGFLFLSPFPSFCFCVCEWVSTHVQNFTKHCATTRKGNIALWTTFGTNSELWTQIDTDILRGHEGISNLREATVIHSKLKLWSMIFVNKSDQCRNTRQRKTTTKHTHTHKTHHILEILQTSNWEMPTLKIFLRHAMYQWSPLSKCQSYFIKHYLHAHTCTHI